MKNLLIFAVMAAAILICPPTWGDGRVELHRLKSETLAKAGEPSQRELSVYLPSGYEASTRSYISIYLLHGLGGTYKTWLGDGYLGDKMKGLFVNKIADDLIAKGQLKPAIIVLPDLNKFGAGENLIASYRKYIVQEVVRFVESTYRAASKPKSRGLAGHSLGAYDALQTIIDYPETFGALAVHSGPLDAALDAVQNQLNVFSKLQIYIDHGRQDNSVNVSNSRNFSQMLSKAGIEHTYIEYEGGHFDKMPDRINQMLQFFSEALVDPAITFDPNSTLAASWGQMKLKQ